jgi:hypothetical protein
MVKKDNMYNPEESTKSSAIHIISINKAYWPKWKYRGARKTHKTLFSQTITHAFTKKR